MIESLESVESVESFKSVESLEPFESIELLSASMIAEGELVLSRETRSPGPDLVQPKYGWPFPGDTR